MGVFTRGLLPGLLVAVLLLLPGCSSNKEKKLTLPDVAKNSIVAVSVESFAGNVHIQPGEGTAIKTQAVLHVDAPDRDRRKLLEESALVTTDTSDPSLLTIISRLSDAVALREGEELTVDLIIEVPSDIKTVVVQSDVGDVTINKMVCMLTVVCNSGDVTVKDSYLSGKSKISNVVGDVNVKLKSIENAQEILINVDVGNISLNVPKRASYTVTVEELSAPGDTWKNKEGNTKLLLSTKVGKVSFQK